MRGKARGRPTTPSQSREGQRAEGGPLPRWLLRLPGLLAFLLYLPALGFDLVWDDDLLFEKQLSAFESVGDLVSPPSGIRQWATTYYRPVVTATHVVERELFAPALARAAHASNLLFHALATVCATFLSFRLLRPSKFQLLGATFSGAVFAIHPIHVESVAWVSGRSDVLASLFLLGSLLAALKAQASGARWAVLVTAGSFLLALGSKEVALAGLVLIPFVLWREAVPGKVRSRGREWVLLAASAGAALLYLALRILAGTESGVGRELADGVGGRLAAAVAYGLMSLVAPWPQSALVVSLPQIASTSAVLAAAACCLVLSLWALRRGDSAWAGAWVFWGASVLPSLPVAVLRVAEAPVAERYLYLPVFAVSLVVGTTLARGLELRAWRVAASVGAVALVSVGCWLSLSRQWVWKNDLSLWTDTVTRAPSSALAWAQLGNAQLEQGDLELAITSFESAAGLADDAQGRTRTFNSLGVARAKRAEGELAEAAFVRSIAVDSSYPQPHFNLGNLKASRAEALSRQTGRFELDLMNEAEAHLKEAIRLDPRFSKAILRLASCRLQRGTYLRLTNQGGGAADAALAESRELALEGLSLTRGGPDEARARQLVEAAERALAR